MEEKLTMRMETLLDNAKALCFEETDLICCLANLSALIMQSVPNINWAGFYLMKQGELILGPFQGKPACTHIALGQGVRNSGAEKYMLSRHGCSSVSRPYRLRSDQPQ